MSERKLHRGMKVDFYPGYIDPGQRRMGEPFVGEIAFIWSESCVALSYLDHNGNQYPAPSVLFLKDLKYVDKKPERYCTWLDVDEGRRGSDTGVKATSQKPDPGA